MRRHLQISARNMLAFYKSPLNTRTRRGCASGAGANKKIESHKQYVVMFVAQNMYTFFYSVFGINFQIKPFQNAHAFHSIYNFFTVKLNGMLAI